MVILLCLLGIRGPGGGKGFDRKISSEVIYLIIGNIFGSRFSGGEVLVLKFEESNSRWILMGKLTRKWASFCIGFFWWGENDGVRVEN